MKVFISWSGPRSKAVAEALRDWLPDVMQAVKPWVSSEDIRKGKQWNLELTRELEGTHVGVICLTPENLTAPWLLFEAGALSKLQTEKDAHVCTYLVNMPYTDVTGPLAGFQHTLAT
jgi:TIR domain